MLSVRNPARERLVQGHLSLGVAVTQARTVDIARIMVACGYDWLFIDLEHGTMPLDTAAQISVAALDAGIAPLVRVPVGEYGLAARALDGGALGIVIPHVDTAEQAAEAVSRLRFPPAGRRSAVSRIPHGGFRSVPAGELMRAVEAATMLVAMIETPRAVANAAAIAAVPGIDALMIGSNDMLLEMDLVGDVMHERLAAAYNAVIEACRTHGKWPGMAGIHAEPAMRRYIGCGARLILSGSDTSLMMAAATQRSAFLRGCAPAA